MALAMEGNMIDIYLVFLDCILFLIIFARNPCLSNALWFLGTFFGMGIGGII